MSDNALIVFPYFTFFTESALWADLVYGISCNVSLSMCLSVPLCKTNFLRSKKFWSNIVFLLMFFSSLFVNSFFFFGQVETIKLFLSF